MLVKSSSSCSARRGTIAWRSRLKMLSLKLKSFICFMWPSLCVVSWVSKSNASQNLAPLSVHSRKWRSSDSSNIESAPSRSTCAWLIDIPSCVICWTAVGLARSVASCVHILCFSPWLMASTRLLTGESYTARLLVSGQLSMLLSTTMPRIRSSSIAPLTDSSSLNWKSER